MRGAHTDTTMMITYSEKRNWRIAVSTGKSEHRRQHGAFSSVDLSHFNCELNTLLDKTQGDNDVECRNVFPHKVCSPRSSPRINGGKNNVVIIIGWTLEFSAYNTFER